MRQRLSYARRETHSTEPELFRRREHVVAIFALA
jgi:hypothetical protein